MWDEPFDPTARLSCSADTRHNGYQNINVDHDTPSVGRNSDIPVTTVFADALASDTLSLADIAAQKRADSEAAATKKQASDDAAEVKKAVQWFARCLSTAAKGSGSKYLYEAASQGQMSAPCHLNPYGDKINHLPPGAGCDAISKFFNKNSFRLPNGVSIIIEKFYSGSCSLSFTWGK